MNEKQKRILMAFIGVLVTGCSVGLFQMASLGTDPFTSFVTGLCNLFNMRFGIFYTIVCACMFFIVFLLDKHYISIATFFNLFGNGFAPALYFTADLGVSVYDAISIIMSDKKIASFRICRIGTDSICVVIGLVLKASIGVGTIVTALFMGPLIQIFKTYCAEPLLYGSRTVKKLNM
jgi:uncharacterized membrane protein YczE